jgi:hypothetical protein
MSEDNLVHKTELKVKFKIEWGLKLCLSVNIK